LLRSFSARKRVPHLASFPGIFLEKAPPGQLAGALGSYSSAVGKRGKKEGKEGAGSRSASLESNPPTAERGKGGEAKCISGKRPIHSLLCSAQVVGTMVCWARQLPPHEGCAAAQ
jgi:hypothetical protein